MWFFFLPEQVCVRERRWRKGYQRAQQREHLQKQSSHGEAPRENLTKESDLQFRGRLGGSPWAVLASGRRRRDEGKRDGERGKGKRRGRGRSRAIQWRFDLTTRSPLKTFCQEKLAINTYNLLSEAPESPGPGVNSPIAMSLNQL